MKRCLKKTIGWAKMSHDEISSLMIEIEAILNSRPLTYVSTENTVELLTPSTFSLVIDYLHYPVPGCSKDSDFQLQPSLQDFNKRLNYLSQTIVVDSTSQQPLIWTEYWFRYYHQHRWYLCVIWPKSPTNVLETYQGGRFDFWTGLHCNKNSGWLFSKDWSNTFTS